MSKKHLVCLEEPEYDNFGLDIVKKDHRIEEERKSSKTGEPSVAKFIRSKTLIFCV